MVALITAVIQLVFLILNTKFQKDSEERKRRDELLTDWDKAIKSGDTDKINALLVAIRNK